MMLFPSVPLVFFSKTMIPQMTIEDSANNNESTVHKCGFIQRSFADLWSTTIFSMFQCKMTKKLNMINPPPEN